MASASERLRELGITLPHVPAPVAAYVPAVVSGQVVHTSGQLPFVGGVLPEAGKVGEGEGLVSPEAARGYARQAALNALAAVQSVIGSLDRVVRVVKVTGFVASAAGFAGQSTVVDGASTLVGEIFGERGRHARSSVGVAELPLGSPVEVELSVEFA
ncbi:MAG TPA: RidA family protein [Microbacteriaceae bacterium]|nr:RidA family protein [Microbacteriaceae bacterium]